MSQVDKRETKYCAAVRGAIFARGHATNAEILLAVRAAFPAVSATTIHRVSARLCERGEITLAPPAPDGSFRYDANTEAHDHFMCATCGRVRDIDIANQVIPTIQKALGNKELVGRLTISGACSSCSH